MSQTLNVNHEKLRSFYLDILLNIGTPIKEASIVSDGLIDADLHGIDSHGALRISSYVSAALSGKINASSIPEVVWTRKSISMIDGKNGWGQPAATLAVKQAISLAKEYGTATISIKNTNHIGTLAWYGRMLAKEGFFSFLTTNAAPNMAAWGGKKPVLGTNPMCFSFPNSSGKPIVVDMANSVVAHGKILLAREKGENIPKGWALDENGNDTIYPDEALKGSILPVGGPKGYGLALIADTLSGVLSGSNYASKVQSIVKEGGSSAGVGAYISVTDISLYDEDQVEKRLNDSINIITDSDGVNREDKILIPGEIENGKYLQRSAHGIDLSLSVIKTLESIANKVNVKSIF